MSILLQYLILKDKSNDFNCDILRAAALETWNRIGFSRTRQRLKILETTITQNIVYELNLLQTFIPFFFKIYESRNERANGDDLEISVRNISGRYYTFALQAKIIYHSLHSRITSTKKIDDG